MNEQNLRPIQKGQLTKEQSKERGSNGGKKSVEVRRRKKSIAELLQTWANSNLDDNQKSKLKEMGIEDDTKKALLVVPLIKNITKGDVRSLQLAIELLNEDKKKQKEIKKLNAEIEKLKLEKLKLEKEIKGEISDEKIIIVNDIPKEKL